MIKYVRPEAEIVAFSNEDVITTSGGAFGSNEGSMPGQNKTVPPTTGFDMNN